MIPQKGICIGVDGRIPHTRYGKTLVDAIGSANLHIATEHRISAICNHKGMNGTDLPRMTNCCTGSFGWRRDIFVILILLEDGGR